MYRRKYAAANVTTNLYVVSQPWLYSLAWCSGAHSVTTNAPQLLSTMTAPLFIMVTTALLCSQMPHVALRRNKKMEGSETGLTLMSGGLRQFLQPVQNLTLITFVLHFQCKLKEI